MSVEIVGLLGVLAMFLLMFLRVPIAIAMFVPAFIGILYLRNSTVLFTSIETSVWTNSFSYTLTTIPMFVLMGELLFVSGISENLYDSFKKWFGKVRGGLAMATIGASAIFSTSSGSSLATIGTLGPVASKEMMKSDYNTKLASGSIIAGGTLGVLIPPSTIFILYGLLSEQSIGRLLIAGIIPGILLALLYILTIYIMTLLNPSLAPKGEATTWKEKIISLKSTVWAVVLFILVIGGMYIGLFSPTEAGGIGAFGAFVIALIRRRLNFENFKQSLSRTLRTTGFLFAIVLAAFVLTYFLAITGLPTVLSNFFSNLSVPVWVIFTLIIFMYILLGALMDTMSMIVVTMPFVLPIMVSLDLDLIWFGVIVVLLVEMSMITPPVGIACFLLEGIVPEYSLGDVFKGSLIFVIPILMLITILYVFPDIALYLPNTMR